jgi:protein-tyrosine phosphatase
MDYNCIQPWLFVGAFPESVYEIEALQRIGVSAVLSLQTDEDIEEFGPFPNSPESLCADRGVRLCRMPVRDFDEPALQEALPGCVAALRRLIDQGNTVYLHCTAGINRSPTVAAAYLHWCSGWDLDTAVKYVKARRRCSPNVNAIRCANWNPHPSPSGADKSSEMEAS